MNTFSIAVSKRLREIGVDVRTVEFWIQEFQRGPEIKDANGNLLIPWTLWSSDVASNYPIERKFPAYTLHDILRLMPEIAKKMGWKYICGDCARQCNEHNEESSCCDYTIMPEWKYNSHRLLDAFLSGDYPEAEKVLLDLLKEHE